jgi:DNA repair exonuclease SbcCD ATPase subunit
MKPVQELESRLTKLVARKESLEGEAERARERLAHLDKRMEAIAEATGHIRKVASEMQNRVQVLVTQTVQDLIGRTFPESGYIFRMNLKETRGQVSLEFGLERDGETIDPTDACGGGVVDVISIGLRCSLLLLSGAPKVLILDEPFKFLSKNLRAPVAELLQDLGKRYGVQTIMVSHDPDFIAGADRVFEAKQVDGICRVIQREEA